MKSQTEINIDHENRIRKLEEQATLPPVSLLASTNAGDTQRRMIQDLTDRACKSRLPNGMGLSEFEEYIRSLYPEYFTKIKAG